MATEASRHKTAKNSFRRPADAPTRQSDVGLAWTGTDGVVLEYDGRRLAISPEAARRFVRALIRGEFAQDETGHNYETTADPEKPQVADIAELPTDRDIAPALVQALGSAAGPAAITAAEAAQNPPVTSPTALPVVTTTSCAW